MYILQGKMPLKWMAPEAILDGIYTSQSDVYVIVNTYNVCIQLQSVS